MTHVWCYHRSASVLCTLALVGVIGTGQAAAQPVGDRVEEGDAGRHHAANGDAASVCMPPGMPALEVRSCLRPSKGATGP